jgi:hypothetical protein
MPLLGAGLQPIKVVYPRLVHFDRLPSCAAACSEQATWCLCPVAMPAREHRPAAGRCAASIHRLRVWRPPPPPRSPDRLDCPWTSPRATVHHSDALVARNSAHDSTQTQHGRPPAPHQHQKRANGTKAHLEVRQHLCLLLLLRSKVDERQRLLLFGGVDLVAAVDTAAVSRSTPSHAAQAEAVWSSAANTYW